MIVLRATNAHDALRVALRRMPPICDRRDSRNGPVLVSPEPVTTLYESPRERVVFWPDRDANPFFHLIEALWMLAGSNDVEVPAYYAKQIREYSDDGYTLHGAYGHRWRHWGELDPNPVAWAGDQLVVIAAALQRDPSCRRQVLQMWDPSLDLGRDGKDVPCNLVAHFQIDRDGCLEMTVFCRSNDAIWGAYGANVVHFSILQEYLALAIGVEVGRYYQVSSNWHIYDNEVYRRVAPIADRPNVNPYDDGLPIIPLFEDRERFDEEVKAFITGFGASRGYEEPFLRDVAEPMHRAYRAFKEEDRPEAFVEARDEIEYMPSCDWQLAATECINRREERWVPAREPHDRRKV